MNTRFFYDDNLGLLKELLWYFGVTHAQYELQGYCVFHFGGADSIANDDDIGLYEHLS